jgi:hypothetical protein
MVRTLLCSLAGAVIGFMVTATVILMVASSVGGRPSATDTVPIISILGILVAGLGAIAGAIIGGVADLKEFYKKKEQASKTTQDRDK